jgi:hypothetical protein
MKKNKDLINREKALKKMGRYAAITALGTFMILNPKKAQAQSGPPDPGGFRLIKIINKK